MERHRTLRWRGLRLSTALLVIAAVLAIRAFGDDLGLAAAVDAQFAGRSGGQASR